VFVVFGWGFGGLEESIHDWLKSGDRFTFENNKTSVFNININININKHKNTIKRKKCALSKKIFELKFQGPVTSLKWSDDVKSSPEFVCSKKDIEFLIMKKSSGHSHFSKLQFIELFWSKNIQFVSSLWTKKRKWKSNNDEIHFIDYVRVGGSGIGSCLAFSRFL
jgi:hypothetical protein